MTAQTYYENLETETQATINRYTAIARRMSWLRVIIFIAIIVALYVLWHNAMACCIAASTGIAAFVAAARYHDIILHRRDIQEVRKKFAQSRLRVLNGDLSQQPRGEQHIDQMHNFSYDLDLFGENSLFSLLDSTSTPTGADYLAEWLKSPLKNPDHIIARQEAIAELAAMNNLRTSIHASGKIVGKTRANAIPDEIPSFSVPTILKATAFAAAPLFITSVALAACDIIPSMWIVWLMMSYLAIAGSLSKRINHLHAWLYSTVESLTSRITLFKQIEDANLSSPLLSRLKKDLQHNDTNASILIKRLARHLKSLDQRYNAVGYILFNGTMLWDILSIIAIDKWMKRHGQYIAVWQNTIGEIDALCSIATFAYENPDYVFPKIDNTNKIIMQAHALGHPLIHKSKRINNPAPEMKEHTFIIITGANMAGKSTYLRTIAINYLLAMTGAPVAASSMTFTPANLFTGLRANDSLANGESYFFAELKRLQSVIHEAAKGQPMFILLDEILRGTNSADKQRGSLAIVKRLISLPVAGILATHDLVLGRLAQEFPDNISNYCFEAEITGDSLSFDYTLRPGIAKNLNAFYLMKNMGII